MFILFEAKGHAGQNYAAFNKLNWRTNCAGWLADLTHWLDNFFRVSRGQLQIFPPIQMGQIKLRKYLKRRR